MRARHVPGLRARLVTALVVTSAVTLAVAAVGLLNPLETRLRHEELKSLSATALAAIPSFEDLDAPPSASVRRALALARGLERRSGARVAVFDARGSTVLDTRPGEPFGAVPQTRTQSKAVGRVRARSNGSAAVAVAAVRFHYAGQTYTLALRKPLDDVTAAANDVEHAFGEAALAGLGVALLLGLGLSAYLVRRIRRLRDATVDVGAQGTDVALPIDTSRDEVGDLARAFRSMQLRLHHQEEARRQFVATASHELRTPLASLQGMLELLDQDLNVDPPDLDDARDQVARAEAQSRRLATLAADLLDLTRLDADVELRAEPVELGELSRAVAAEFELRVATVGARIELELDETGCWATGDPGSIARIVRILVDNALRFSPSDMPVSISTARRDDAVEVEVRDCGPGVGDDEREVIFERFRRGRGAAGEGGFGLGLAIGRGLAERMGGTLTLEPSDRGARFVLRLPVSREGVPPPVPAAATRD
jgi:signal transduction histidine kinase